MYQKPKAFEDIKHDHDKNPTRLQEKTCQRCKFDTAEKSLVQHIKNHSLNDKIKAPRIGTKLLVDVTFVKMIVVRGHLDDCIGWTKSWS